MELDNLEALKILLHPDENYGKPIFAEAAFTIRRLIEKDKKLNKQKQKEE